MARLNLNKQPEIDTKNINLGRVVVFCEGKTEENYFEYFSKIIRNNNNKFTSLDVIPILAGGNAQEVLNFADNFLCDEKNKKYFALYEKYLVFDCDDPKDIQSVINAMLKNSEYKLLPTNLLFESWLIMHFEEVEAPMKKKEIYEKMKEYLNIEKYNSKEKACRGNVAKIIGDGTNVHSAIKNAKKLHKKYNSDKLFIGKDIVKMNPYSEVYVLVTEILNEMCQFSK